MIKERSSPSFPSLPHSHLKRYAVLRKPVHIFRYPCFCPSRTVLFYLPLDLFFPIAEGRGLVGLSAAGTATAVVVGHVAVVHRAILHKVGLRSELGRNFILI